LLAKQVLSQLSYGPIGVFRSTAARMVGLGGLEPPASPLSGVRSNHLSYRPMMQPRSFERSGYSEKSAKDGRICFPRKELRVKQLCAWIQVPCVGVLQGRSCSKGGDPAAPSDTATLLRLHP